MRLSTRFRNLLAIVCGLAAASSAYADGSVSFHADVLPIMQGRPLFQQFILQTFVVSDAGWGTRIDSPTMPKLGGARMGPYRFQAIWHAPDGDRPVTLIVVTRVRFFDDQHREILSDDLRKAATISETLDSIEVEPPENH
jgi:hypothetical protein